MSLKNYSATSLTGGGSGALDSIDGTNLQDLDSCIVFTIDTFYFYILDVDSATAESSPTVISPDTNAGDKRWILVASLGVSGSLTLSNTGLHILDTDASHDLILKPGSDILADRTLTITTGDSDRTITFSGNPTLADWFDQAVKAASSPTFAGITLNNTGLHILDTNASHDLIIAPGSDLTADRTLTLTTGDADRTITLSGNPTLADWFDQSVKAGSSPAFTNATLTTPTLNTPTLNATTINTSVAGTAFLDEDDMASDSAVKVCSQQSIKAFVEQLTLTNRGIIDGFKLENDTDTEHDIKVNAGVCRDAANTMNIELSAALTKQIDANWVAGDGAGGFPSALALAADTWYYFFVISSADGTTVDAGFDTSLTATNLLTDAAGYTKYRRVGAILTNSSSNIINFIQSGDYFWWKLPALDVDVASLSQGTVDYTLSIPPLDVIAIITATTYSAGVVKAYVQDVAKTAYTPVQTDEAGTVGNLSTGDGEDSAIIDTLIHSTNSDVTFVAASSVTRLKIVTQGWIDARGKNS